MKKSAALTVLIMIAGLALTGCGKKQQQAMTAPPPPEVTVAKPLVKQISDWDDYVGQFKAVQTVEVRPRVSGYLVAAGFREGDLVKTGDLLFQIDARPFQASLDEARAQLNVAKVRAANADKEFARARDLMKTHAISVESRDALESAAQSADAEVAAAEAAVRSAELDVGFTRITAPIDGRVSYRRVDIGNAVKADDTVLTTITSVDPIQFVFQASEAQDLKYQRRHPDVTRSPVRIRLQDETKPRWTGYLDFMDNALNPDTGTIRGRAMVANPDGFLKPGMFGHMQLQATDKYNGILLPDTAIATRGALRIVFVVDSQDKVGTRVVALGPLHDGLRVIRSGLTPEDRVIIKGLQRARPGQPVKVDAGTIAFPDNSTAAAATGQANGTRE